MFDVRTDSGDDSNKFIRPKNDGDSIKGCFAGAPLRFRNHWHDTSAGKRSVVCGGVECALCKQGNKAKARFRCNFIIAEGTGYVAKIFEGGNSVYDQLAEVGTEYDLKKSLVKISRKGAGLDTVYSVIVAPPAAQPTPEQFTQMGKVTLLDLDPNKDGQAEFAPGSDSEVPF